MNNITDGKKKQILQVFTISLHSLFSFCTEVMKINPNLLTIGVFVTIGKTE